MASLPLILAKHRSRLTYWSRTLLTQERKNYTSTVFYLRSIKPALCEKRGPQNRQSIRWLSRRSYKSVVHHSWPRISRQRPRTICFANSHIRPHFWHGMDGSRGDMRSAYRLNADIKVLNHTFLLHTTSNYETVSVLELTVWFDYWDWTLDAHNIEASPLFDGSDSNRFCNGLAVPHGDLRKVFAPAIPSIVNYSPLWHWRRLRDYSFANITVAFGQVS